VEKLCAPFEASRSAKSYVALLNIQKEKTLVSNSRSLSLNRGRPRQVSISRTQSGGGGVCRGGRKAKESLTNLKTNRQGSGRRKWAFFRRSVPSSGGEKRKNPAHTPKGAWGPALKHKGGGRTRCRGASSHLGPWSTRVVWARSLSTRGSLIACRLSGLGPKVKRSREVVLKRSADNFLKG